MTVRPEHICERATLVAEQDADHSLAIAECERAHADALRTVLEKAVPAHRALSSALPMGSPYRGLLLIDTEDGGFWWIYDGLDSYLGKREADESITKLTPDDLVLLFGEDGAVTAIEAISRAMDQQLRGNKRTQTEKMHRLAARIRAFVTLFTD